MNSKCFEIFILKLEKTRQWRGLHDYCFCKEKLTLFQIWRYLFNLDMELLEILHCEGDALFLDRRPFSFNRMNCTSVSLLAMRIATISFSKTGCKIKVVRDANLECLEESTLHKILSREDEGMLVKSQKSTDAEKL